MNKNIWLSILVVILAGLGIWYFTKSPNNQNLQNAATTTTPPATIAVKSTKNNLRQINLNKQYAVQIPLDYKYSQATTKITNVPSFDFESKDGLMRFDINILPYLVSNTQVSGKTTISSDGSTVYSNGITMRDFFYTPGIDIASSMKVFYGIHTEDASLGH